MAQFTQQDLSAFSTCLLALYTSQPGLPFATQALRALSALIPVDLCFYVTIDFHTPHASSAVMEPPTLTFPGDNRDVVATVIREHPIVQYWTSRARGTPLCSLLLPRRPYHRLMLYQTYYRPLAIEYQLGVRIPSSPTLHDRCSVEPSATRILGPGLLLPRPPPRSSLARRPERVGVDAAPAGRLSSRARGGVGAADAARAARGRPPLEVDRTSVGRRPAVC